jgi:hypothetical protein
VATGGTATSPSGGIPGSAFDGSNATSWVLNTGITAGEITYQLSSAQDIVEHALVGASTVANSANRWAVYWSDNNVDYTPAALVGGQTGWTANEKRVFTHASYPAAIGSGVPVTVAPVALSEVQPGGVKQFNYKTSDPMYSRDAATFNTDRFITGVVKQDGVTVVRTVRAYDRASGALIGETKSNGSGAFSILSKQVIGYCTVIALDDLASAPDYNAVIADLVIPTY